MRDILRTKAFFSAKSHEMDCLKQIIGSNLDGQGTEITSYP